MELYCFMHSKGIKCKNGGSSVYEVKSLDNGFEYVVVDNEVASAKIALQGAHIYEYKRQGKRDILWCSQESDFEYSKAIRGGIPICWPRFGVLDKSMPAHGFSRTSLFTLKSVKEITPNTTEVRLFLQESRASRAIWDYKFDLEIVFTISESLSVEIITTNTDDKEFMITEALHSYFGVSHIDDVKIEGLAGKKYRDTLVDKKFLQEGAIVINQEVDRVYQGVAQEIVLQDASSQVHINAKGSSSTVVWNPWIEKGSNMSGMNKDAYKEFVCIETANAFDDFIVLKSGETHKLCVILSD